MKALLKKTVSSIHSFTVKEFSDPAFDPNWHFHPEYQLFCVIEGSGTRFIGDNIKHFQYGDMVFLGPNMPHLWRSDDYLLKNEKTHAHGIVIYFEEDFLGKDFFEKQEMVLLKQLFEKAGRGIELTGSTQKLVLSKMQSLVNKEGFERVMSLLDILHTLACTQEYSFIASVGFENNFKHTETERMRVVHEYVMQHFRQEISLDKVAALANMSPSAFCRYFKARANKTFTDFVSEVRIGHACRLLIEGNMNVSQLAYECGYKTISNFNRQFKEIVKESPLKYQQQYMQKAR
jgi:AraC-like DNA-binding protein